MSVQGIAASLLVASFAVAASTALAEKGPTHDPRAAHKEADTNGDGHVDRAEFHARMVEIFFHGDSNKDGYMVWAELAKAVALPDDFRDADRNGDGRYSLYEFIEVRFHDFGIVDTNHDGLLSVEEVVKVFERGGVR